MSLAECSSLHNKRRFLSDGNGGDDEKATMRKMKRVCRQRGTRPFVRPSCQKGVLKTANSRFDGRNRTKKDGPRLALPILVHLGFQNKLAQLDLTPEMQVAHVGQKVKSCWTTLFL